MHKLKITYSLFLLFLVIDCNKKRTFSSDEIGINFSEVERIEIRNPKIERCENRIKEISITDKNAIKEFIIAINNSQLDGPWKGACFNQIRLITQNSTIELSSDGNVFGFGSSGMFYRLPKHNKVYFKDSIESTQKKEVIQPVISLSELNETKPVNDFDFKTLVEKNKIGIEVISNDSQEAEYRSKYLGEIYIPAYSKTFHVVTQLILVQVAQVKHGHSLLIFLDENFETKQTYNLSMPNQLPRSIVNNELLFNIEGIEETLDLKEGLPVIFCMPNDECL